MNCDLIKVLRSFFTLPSKCLLSTMYPMVNSGWEDSCNDQMLGFTLTSLSLSLRQLLYVGLNGT